MSRVLQDTSLRRAAVTALVLATTALSACGGGDEEATPAASTPAQTTPARSPIGNAAAAASAAVDVSALDIDKDSTFSDTPETKRTVRKASDARISSSELDDQVAAATKALEAAGIEAKTVGAFGDAKQALKVDATTILFYGDDEAAAQDMRQYGELIEGRPGYSRTARDDNRGYFVIRSQKLSDADLTTFRAVRAVVEGAV